MIASVIHIVLMADEAPWALYRVPGGLLHEDTLPLSEPTKLQIKAWMNAYDDSCPRRDWPVWTPPADADDEEEEEAWGAEGERLRDLIAAELGPGYEVTFEP
jgi:hypothetical protein